VIAVDDLYGAFRSALVGDATVNGLVTGGWRQGRQTQAIPAAGPYGIILLSPGRVVQSSSFIERYYTLTLTAYSPASATFQSSLQTALATLLDYKPANVPFSTGGSINMISPVATDQRMEREMRSGTDVIPVVCQWSVRCIETRA
jgi:hypothetical protein